VDFSFSSDQQLLRNAARSFLDERCTPAVVRALWDDARGEGELLWKEMAQLGWLGLALPEAHGGSGLGMVEAALVLDEMGRAAYPGPYLPTVLAGLAIAHAGNPAQQARWLPAIATGSARASVALVDAEVDWEPQAVRTRAERGSAGLVLTGLKQFVPWAHLADLLLVPARGSEGLSVFLVETAAPGLHLSPVAGMDPGTRWVTVRLDGTPVAAEGMLGVPGEGGALLSWLTRRAAVGAAAEMLGAARRCLDMSVAYAKVREQFGQPIGSFQAIRHKCAEMLLEVENSHAATYYAAWALDADADDGPLAASIAKAYVAEGARRVCGDAIQVHGGIGFTWEYDLHLYMKRAKALEVMYGDTDYHRELIVRHVAPPGGRGREPVNESAQQPEPGDTRRGAPGGSAQLTPRPD
jgi:alkylation response protein AidB-like acyl-CoA dehydrogenase